jgi:diguanylate cyclase (GGDEF)-like protein/PAS domain S-box-containing protein
MTPEGPRRRGQPSDADLEMLDRQNDLVVLLDGDGFVTYGNPTAFALLGYSKDQLVGEHIADLVHPEDLGGAVEAVGDLHAGVQVTAAIFRLRRRDGAFMPMELNATSRIDAGPFAGSVVVIGRYPGDYDIHTRISQMLTEGAPVADVIGLIPEFGLWRHPDRSYLVMYEDTDGETALVGSELAARLVREHAGEDTPWARAISSRASVVSDPAEFPEKLRRASDAAGLASCLVRPVPDPLRGSTAVVIEWATNAGAPLSLHRYSVGQMSKALSLILHWRRHIAELERAARSDHLTGLSNRASFFDQLERRLGIHDRGSRAGDKLRPGEDEVVGVLYVDLDRFKVVNDVYGHGMGDEVLIEVARRMSCVLRERDLLARLGGDEFAVLCLGLHKVEEVTAVADRLLVALNSEQIEADGQSVSISASIGIALAPTPPLPGGSDALLERADDAMYEAKRAGRNRWVFADTQ